MAIKHEFKLVKIKNSVSQGAWLAQLEKRATLDLRVMSSNLMMGVQITKKVNFKNKKSVSQSH